MQVFYPSHPSALALLQKCKDTLEEVRADDSDVIQDINRYLIWKNPKEELPEIPEGAEWVDVWVIPSQTWLIYKQRKTFFNHKEIQDYMEFCRSWVYALDDDNEPALL